MTEPYPERASITGLVELTLEVDDLDRAIEFYEDILGLDRLTREADKVWLKVGGATRLGLWRPGTKEFGDQGGRHVHFAFSVSAGRLLELRERLTGCNIHVRGPVEHAGGDRSIYFEDPFGNLVEAWDVLDPGNAGEDAVGE